MRFHIIAHETHVLLRRNKVFLPMLVLLVILSIGAFLTGLLVEKELHRILFDFSLAGMHVAGGAAAIFWGVKMMTDSRDEGSLEVQLASPASRHEFILGKYLGLAATLLLIGFIYTVFGQFMMLAAGLEWITLQELIALTCIVFIWLVLGAFAIFFASFCNNAVAVFSCLCVWGLGALSPYLIEPAAAGSATASQTMVMKALSFWNLQRLNLSDLLYTADFPDAAGLAWRAVYAVSCVVLVLALTAMVFSRLDVGSRG